MTEIQNNDCVIKADTQWLAKMGVCLWLVVLTLWVSGAASLFSKNAVARADAHMGNDSAGFYRWGDETEEFCTYEWVNVTDATILSLAYNEVSDAIPLGFDFPYYLETYTSIQVYSGGFLVFEPLTSHDSTELSEMPWDAPLALITGIWADLDPSQGGMVRYKTMGSSGSMMFVLEFNAIPLRTTGDTVTFEIVLFEGSGDFQIIFQDTGDTLGAYENNVGIVDPHGVAGFQFIDGDSFGVRDNSTLCFMVNAGGEDSDVDGVTYYEDNCPTVANVDQANSDNDHFGDACDICPDDPDNDIDGDTICGDQDNCPLISNENQEDADGDGVGDACDPCPDSDDVDTDGDGVCDLTDNCPEWVNGDQEDADGDGVGDACDPCPDSDDVDTDGDGVCDLTDNCPVDANEGQDDTDGDGEGDACDTCPLDAVNDVDEDGICGDVDNCPTVSNEGQEDADDDGVGNACDEDYNESSDDTSGCGCAVGQKRTVKFPLLLVMLLGAFILRRRLRE